MLDTGHMNFFTVENCGLYKVGRQDTYGCELTETFDLINKWFQTRTFNTTIPWDPTSARRNKPKCYCQDIYKDDSTGDFVIVLWKSDTDSKGNLWGMGEDSKAGSGTPVKLSSKHKGKKMVWGRPAYYWVIPKYNIIVSIKFDHSVCDAQLFEDYVKACITNRVKHPNRKVHHTEHGHARISYIDEDKKRYLYRFKMHLKSLDTSSAELQSLAANVTHIVRRETIIVNSNDEKAQWVNIFNKIPYMRANPKSKKRKIEIRAEAKPTAKELKKIIEDNATEGRKPTDWDNVGFSTDKGTMWADKFRMKGSIRISGQDDEIYNAAEIFSYVAKERNQLLAPIVREIRFSDHLLNESKA